VRNLRAQAVETLVKKYRTIPQLLGKIEEVVAGTNSGRCPTMASYYVHWEAAIFNALNHMVVKAMEQLVAMIQQPSSKDTDGARPKVPLFKVHFSLSNPEVFVMPSIQVRICVLSQR